MASLFPIPVVVEAAAPTLSLEAGDLYPEELRSVETAVEKRRAEFLSARRCARRALVRLGAVPGPIPSGPDRAPVWPAGFVGSISHTLDLCIAAVARSADVGSIGVDVENGAPLGADLLHMICTPRDVAWLEMQPADERTRWAKVMFSAKEAFFKCQFARTGAMLDFQDVDLDLAATGSFVATRIGGSPLATAAIVRGRWTREGHHVLTAAWLPG